MTGHLAAACDVPAPMRRCELDTQLFTRAPPSCLCNVRGAANRGEYDESDDATFRNGVRRARRRFTRARWPVSEATATGRDGWIFLSDEDRSRIYATPIETHQHDRLTILGIWADRRVRRRGARAGSNEADGIRGSDLLDALQELVQALDRRRPHLERAGEGSDLGRRAATPSQRD
jgi:hypothetical protein